MEINQYLIDFYGSYNEDNRMSSRLGSIEFITTMTYIEKYLKTNDKILEIGAGTGRYSHILARLGYRVDAVELIEHNIEIFQKNTLQDENISIKQVNALDLSMISDNKYDITLLLGPLYHLYNVKDKKQAISEALSVTKKRWFNI
ncbi:class I SAM-dependent methyltransferase [Floricoccus tropicus]|uniref:class I SAM-dependent methyltransferase n=1 Tax=Floricoccus tropicus TaxID=1859473 RepID=UPI000AF782EC|nr:class I SAM-dependent methyltransferase [Floricoccus tropicus]